MKKNHITRTFGPIHFEDLDPHRFEDLVRELIYDFKDWKTIEATGRAGGDDGFDIRAFERRILVNPTIEDINEEDGQQMEVEGNLWMIQCKRENEVGPTKIKNILSSNVRRANIPYGYILVTSANLSIKSYDVFRNEARELGICEFYIWGKAELEDMLHMPKYDRILFTFFGISLQTRRQSKTNELRQRISTKNKLIKLLGGLNFYQRLFLIRDINNSEYPRPFSYPNYFKNPPWLDVEAFQFSTRGLWVKCTQNYAYVNVKKGTWDLLPESNLLTMPNIIIEENGGDNLRDLQHKASQQWNKLEGECKGMATISGEIAFEDILFIDEKGDALYEYPHIYLGFRNSEIPFRKMLTVLEVGGEEYSAEPPKFKRVDFFDKKSTKK